MPFCTPRSQVPLPVRVVFFGGWVGASGWRVGGEGRVDGVRVGEVGGLVYSWGSRSLGLIRFRLNQIRVSKV